MSEALGFFDLFLAIVGTICFMLAALGCAIVLNWVVGARLFRRRRSLRHRCALHERRRLT